MTDGGSGSGSGTEPSEPVAFSGVGVHMASLWGKRQPPPGFRAPVMGGLVVSGRYRSGFGSRIGR